MAIRWQSDGNQMAILPFSYTHETQSQSHSPTRSPPAMPTHDLKNAITTPPATITIRLHSPAPPAMQSPARPRDDSSRAVAPAAVPLPLRGELPTCNPQHSQMWSSGTAINGHLEKVSQIKVRSDERGVPADARSSVLNLSSTRPFNASECRLQSQSNHHMRRKYHNHTPAEVRTSSKRRLSSSRHAATLRLLCS